MFIVVLYRNLRIFDNPSLFYAAIEAKRSGRKLCIIYNHDSGKARELGGAAKWFLHHTLKELECQLASKGLKISYLLGDIANNLDNLIQNCTGEVEIFADLPGDHEGSLFKVSLAAFAKQKGIKMRLWNTGCLIDYDKIRTQSGDTFKVFTPFWKTAKTSFIMPEKVDEIPVFGNDIAFAPENSLELDDLKLLTSGFKWHLKLEGLWEFSQAGILRKMEEFVDHRIQKYAQTRNLPSTDGHSKLSPYLHFGQISPYMIIRRIRENSYTGEDINSVDNYITELGWREFCYYILYHNPRMENENFRADFANFKWQAKPDFLQKWQKGLTGYPMVDAGMRQLWREGWMHNRVRMVVGSFLTKDLLQHWKAGEEWFWDTLVDADFSQNIFNWQWVCGSGCDAAPYFRIFNPSLQSKRFDPDAIYIKKYVPELCGLDSDNIHNIHLPIYQSLRHSVGYPDPIVDHDIAKKLAMDLYKQIKL